MDIYELAQAWLVILEGGGLTTGGTNFDAKTRRNSTDLEDIFIAHIGGMDAFARALMIAADILEHSDYRKMRAERYASFDAGEARHSRMASLRWKIFVRSLCVTASRNRSAVSRNYTR